MVLGYFKRTTLSDRQEAAVQKTFNQLRAQRRSRFRILACIDGSEESTACVRTAARLAVSDNCDIIILYVRPIDQGLHSGGLQVRLARQNMIDAGFELPGVKHLKDSLSILKAEGLDVEGWEKQGAHANAWGDAAGDTKVEYKSPEGRSVVLKLKTAPDVAGGILDQYELGPYNLMILGAPSRWRGEVSSFFGSGVVQTVATMSPCSVLVARPRGEKRGFFIYTDGTSRSLHAVRRSAVLAHTMGEPITLFAVAPAEDQKAVADEAIANASALLRATGITVAETRVAIGDPLQEIVERGATHHVICVTDEGRNRWQRLFKGSLASEVLRLARSSVLDVR
jgi:nucleotide-binding universal stress UspA family protein